jgi:hypothetical protein
MAIVKGTNSYITRAEADTYWADRNNSDWAAASDAAKDAALYESAAYLDGNYSWVGTLEDLAQLLGWPRSSAYDKEGRTLSGVPSKVEDAQSELALQALSGVLVPSQSKDDTRTKKEKVGEIEVEYFDNSKIGRVYDYVDLLLDGLYEPSGNTVQLVRA